MEDVYREAEPNATLTEIGIARAAWGGWPAYEEMTRSELHIAQYILQQWSRALEAVPDDEIPAGLHAIHDLNVRRIEIHASAILTYLNNDIEAYNILIKELWGIEETAYTIGLHGVAQCGDQWIDAMGEPWDPSPDATPDATPAR